MTTSQNEVSGGAQVPSPAGQARRAPSMRLLFLIATPKLTERANDLFEEGRVPAHCQLRARGTATSEMRDLLGLDSTDRMVSIAVLPQRLSGTMLRKLERRLHLGDADTGVAFTLPLSGGSAHLLRMLDGSLDGGEGVGEGGDEGAGHGIDLVAQLQKLRKTEENEKERAVMAEPEYALIMAIIDQGYSEEVMAAAREVGASGGTVFHCRQVGGEEAVRFWGITMQREREIIMILTERASKRAIMQAVGERYGMATEAHGVLFSLPVDEVAGIG